MNELGVKGLYLDGVETKSYLFSGKLLLDESSFVGFVNDGRCPAEIIDGNVKGGFWRFIKKYRSDVSILRHPFFAGHAFSEPNMGNDVCDEFQGVIYYGRTIKSNNKRVFVSGFYNSLKTQKGYDDHDRVVRRLTVADKDTVRKAIEEIKEHKVASGPWNMEVTSREILSQLREIPLDVVVDVNELPWSFLQIKEE